jgi:hypothetical protein
MTDTSMTCPESESSLLGSLMVEPDQLPSVKKLVKPEYFSDSARRLIYEAILQLSESNGQEADAIAIANYLRSEKRLEDAGGAEALHRHMSECPNCKTADRWARDVRRSWQAREARNRLRQISASPLPLMAEEIKDIAETLEKIGQGSDEATEKPLTPEYFLERSGAPIQLAEKLLPQVEESVDYLIEPVLVTSCLTQLHGEPKSGKSCFGLHLAICAATGMDPGGGVCKTHKSCPVLYLAFEDGPRRLKRRQIDYMAGLGFDNLYSPGFHFWIKPDIDLGSTDGLALMLQALRFTGAQLLVLDTISHVHRADENDASEMKVVMANLTRISREAKCAILYIHHSAKGEGRSSVYKGRGSSAIVAAADVVIDWGRPDHNVTKCEFLSKDDEAQTWHVHYDQIPTGVKWTMTEDEYKGRSATESEVFQALIQLAHANPNGVTAKQVGDSIEMTKRNAGRVLEKLLAEKKIKAQPGRNRTVYFLPL